MELQDFTITISQETYEHMLAHARACRYSNGEWAVPCVSESVLSLKRGVR